MSISSRPGGASMVSHWGKAGLDFVDFRNTLRVYAEDI